jgi:hypothetical protein
MYSPTATLSVVATRLLYPLVARDLISAVENALISGTVENALISPATVAIVKGIAAG